MSAPLLRVEGLTVEIPDPYGGEEPLRLLDGLTFSLERGESLGLVGESGCGKSMTALALMALLPDIARVSGSIRLEGQELTGLSERDLRALRGRRMAMVFQEPMTALNPVQTIGDQVAESLVIHLGLTRGAALQRAGALLERVGLPQQRFPLGLYPHQLSGGQRQRVVIAIALACEPALLVADEPTTALDVTTQAQILDLIVELAAETGMGLVMISHDLGVIAETTDRMLVMYAGRIVESGTTGAVFARLAHPYSRGLFAALPQVSESGDRAPLATIPGQVPSRLRARAACTFAPRCPRAEPVCRAELPPWKRIPPDPPRHDAYCFFPHEEPTA